MPASIRAGVEMKKGLIVGAVVAVLAAVVVWGLGDAEEFERPVESPVVGSAAGPACMCSQGGVCTGPRGGRYCWTDGGKKTYVGG